jgi:hypothetical protein
MKIHFVTPTIIDSKAWSIVGLSSKPNSDNPIGQFGTGLKYAIAICMRQNWPITFTTFNQSEESRYSFTTKTEDFRGKNVEIIYCNNTQLPFTTHYGSHWKDWAVIRELWSNCLDENGYMEVGKSNPQIAHGTVITIESDALCEIYESAHLYFLGSNNQSYDKNIVFENSEYQILDGEYKGKVYLKGILVGERPDCKYGYNILTNLLLTEDRTMSNQYQFETMIMRAILESAWDERKTGFLLSDGYDEGKFDIPWMTTIHPEMEEKIKELAALHPDKISKIIKSQVFKNNLVEYNVIDFTQIQSRMLNLALEALKNAGFKTDYQIRMVEIKDRNLIAFVEGNNPDVVNVTGAAFKNQDYLVSTLIEEFSHCEGYTDESRSYEQYLCENLARLIWAYNLNIVETSL